MIPPGTERGVSPSMTGQRMILSRWCPYRRTNVLSMFVSEEKLHQQQVPSICKGTLFSLPEFPSTPPSLALIREHMFQKAEDLLKKTENTAQKRTQSSTSTVFSHPKESPPNSWKRLEGFKLESSPSTTSHKGCPDCLSATPEDCVCSSVNFFDPEIVQSPLSSFGFLEDQDLANLDLSMISDSQYSPK